MTRPEYRAPLEGYTRWSASDLESFLRCSVAFWRRKTDRTIRANVSLATGSAIHIAAQQDAQARKRGNRLRVSEIVEVATSAYTTVSSTSQMTESVGSVMRGKDAVVAAAEEYAIRVAPLVAGEFIEAIETPMYAYVETDGMKIELCGTPDRVESWPDWSQPNYRLIPDIKTGQKWTASDAHKSWQLSIYAEIGRASGWNTLLAIDNVYQSGGSTNWRSQRLITDRDGNDRAAIWSILSSATKARTAGIETPASRGSWWCSKKWCPYWSDCKYVIGRSREDCAQ